MKRASKFGSLQSAVCITAAGIVQAIAATAAAQGERVELTIEIRGIQAQAGAVAIAVFDDVDHYEARENPVARAFVPVAGDSLAWKVTLPGQQRYAVMAYHDVNENGQIDLGRFGIPREPYGFSNDARSPLGPPRFTAAGFELAGEPAAIRIRVK